MQKCKNNEVKIYKAAFSRGCYIISNNTRCDIKEVARKYLFYSYRVRLCPFIINDVSVSIFRGLADSCRVSLAVSVATLSSPLRARMLN